MIFYVSKFQNSKHFFKKEFVAIKWNKLGQEIFDGENLL